MRVVSQAKIRPHVLQFPAAALAAPFRSVAERMLNWAGVDWGDSSRDRARAIVGWFGAHAVHPQVFLHPDGTALNTGVLPEGETWASFNAVFGPDARANSDNAYWFGLFPNGVTTVQRLIGTVDINGNVADDGMLEEVEPGVWRIRNLTDFRSVQCTHQCKMAQVILASMGILAVDISTVGHDPMCYYDIEAGKWFYIDPTFGEMLVIGGESATPLDVLKTSLDGNKDVIVGDKLPGCDYIAVGYFSAPNEPAGGMSYMTIHTQPKWAGGLSSRVPYRFGTLPSQSSANDLPGTVAQLMPVLGTGVGGLAKEGAIVEARLRTNWPEHAGFQRSNDGGATWAACSATEYATTGDGEVRFRSVNAEPFGGTPAIIDV